MLSLHLNTVSVGAYNMHSFNIMSKLNATIHQISSKILANSNNNIQISLFSDTPLPNAYFLNHSFFSRYLYSRACSSLDTQDVHFSSVDSFTSTSLTFWRRQNITGCRCWSCSFVSFSIAFGMLIVVLCKMEEELSWVVGWVYCRCHGSAASLVSTMAQDTS